MSAEGSLIKWIEENGPCESTKDIARFAQAYADHLLDVKDEEIFHLAIPYIHGYDFILGAKTLLFHLKKKNR